MTTFQALMALSATQTRESQSAVQSALAQRQRNEELKLKQQAERERKELELQRKLRMKHFEDEKRERERQVRLQEERAAKEAALQKREGEIRDALRYGPKKAKALSSAVDSSAPKWPSSSSQSRVRDKVRRQRLPGDDDDDDNSSAPEFLTREEKRERKQQMEMRKLLFPSKRSSNAGGYSKYGKRLPGGAVDVMTTAPMMDTASSSSKSVKERITAMPNTLTKLNIVKRDTRTIDEILQDRAKAREVKILDGDEAREFSDWFGTTKKKEAAKKLAARHSPSAANSGANTPASQGSNSTPQPSIPAPSKAAAAPVKHSQTKTAASAKSTTSISTGSKTATSSRPTQSVSSMKFTKTSVSLSATNGGRFTTTSTSAKKRPRSPSLSESPPPKKRAPSHQDEATSTMRDEIWKLFGRDRNSYVSKDVLSDDEDMEADATILEREEKISARIAKKEDVLALEEERRREEEKRRRKKEKEARERRA